MILHNERYTGKVPFGKFKRTLKKGTKTRIKTDGLKWAERRKLRIIPPDLWAAVQKHNEEARKTYIRENDGTLWGRPGMGTESRYLLTGLGRCACCGGNITVLGGWSGGQGRRKRVYYYGCSYRQNRGSTVCSNDHRGRMELMNSAVLDAVDEQVLTPNVVTAAVERALDILAERRRSNPNRPREIDRELRNLQRELDNFLGLVAKDKAPESVLQKIIEREQAIKRLEAERDQLVCEEPKELDLRRLRKHLEERGGNFCELLAADVPQAGQALRKLLAEPLHFTPYGGGRPQGVHVRGQNAGGRAGGTYLYRSGVPKGIRTLCECLIL